MSNNIGFGDCAYLNSHRPSTLGAGALPVMHANTPCPILADFLIANGPTFIIASYALSNLGVERGLDPRLDLNR